MVDIHKFGDKTKAIIAFIVGFISFQLLFHFVIKPNDVALSPSITECKADSLQNVIGNLQSDIKILEDGFDSREHRYEDILLEYDFGLSYLKDYHPKAYKDFHRIVGFKERYSFELERENKQRLNINE
jgi:hypothetical protein